MYDTICRVCLKQCNAETMVPITEKPGKRSYLTFAKVLVKFAKISKDYNDILPTKLCQNCKKMIENMYSFTIMCRNNDRKLQKFVKLADNDGEKCKALICEFALFCQYFPTYSRSQAKNYIPEADKVFKCDENNYNRDQSSFHNLRSKSKPSDLQSASSVLDSIENVVSKMQPDDDNADILLDSIERASKMQQDDFTADILLDSIERASEMKHDDEDNADILLDSIEKAINSKLKYHHNKTVMKHRLRLKYTQPKIKRPKVQRRNFQCKICNKVLANKHTYDYHIQQHTNYKFICDQCGKGYPGKDSLNRHLVTKHDMGSFINCSQCSFKCSKNFELVEHLRIHTGERPFACDKCGLTFRRRAIWRMHQLHHQEKTKSCKLCQKKFHTNGQMKAHLNSTHERLFLYLCHVCNTTFAKNGTVRKHLAIKHGIPREKQGKITRISREMNSSLFTDNK